ATFGRCSFGAFLNVKMCFTPGMFSAAEVSTSFIYACGCGEVRNRTYSRSGNQMRFAYIALPWNRGMETSGNGGKGVPITLRFWGGYPCHFLVTVRLLPSITSSLASWPPLVE